MSILTSQSLGSRRNLRFFGLFGGLFNNLFDLSNFLLKLSTGLFSGSLGFEIGIVKDLADFLFHGAFCFVAPVFSTEVARFGLFRGPENRL
jgi:hypothetical protein